MPDNATDVIIEACALAHGQKPEKEYEDENVVIDTSVPSSEYEQRIVDRLRWLLDMSQVNLQESVKVGRIALEAVLFHQGVPVAFTFIMLVVSSVLYPTAQTITCTVLFSVLYALCMAVQVYLLWARITEKKMHAVAVMTKVLARWARRVAEMSGERRQSQQERLAAFRESTAVLPARAFRMVAVVDESTGRLKHILKSLMMKSSKRLDEAKLCARRYMEPVGLCKLVDVMHITLECDSIVLRPLRDKARPPRHPNLHITSGQAEEEESDTTDDSDHDHDPRTDVSGANTNSVSQKMEFLVHRILLLLWLLGVLLTTTVGGIIFLNVGEPFGESVILYPAVALLGLLPVNAILLNRFLVLYANVYLNRLFHYLVAKPVHTLEDRIPRFSFVATMKALWHVVWHRPGRHLICFSSSIVESLGMATVVALLDITGVVTDMVPLPTRMLMFKRNEQPESFSTSDDDGIGVNTIGGTGNNIQDDDAATTFLPTSSVHDRRRERRKRVGRKNFHERRFFDLRLTPSQRDDLAVQFADEKEFEARQKNVNPVALCLLLHALVPESVNVETWMEPFRFCDRTLRWARSTHWISRACGFDDSVAASFHVISRIFHVDTKKRAGYRKGYPEQTSTLLVEDVDGLLHAFTVGTVYMVARSSPLHFTGSSIEELDEEARTELIHVGMMVWEEGMGLETVAVAHRMLPEEYRLAAEQLRVGDNKYSEFFFRNGIQVTASGKLREMTTTESRNDTKQKPKHQQHQQKEEEHRQLQDEGEELPLSQLEEQQEQCLSNEKKFESILVDGDGTVFSLGNSTRKSVQETDNDNVVTTPASVDSLLDFLVGNSYVFLGLVGLIDSIRPNVQSAMSVLEEAGIRCMYFCDESERRTKSFGSRLGFETDWNCCISLKEGAVDLDPHSIRAQLPVGINAIRKHILHVDSIPLQVNMFSHAHGVSTRAMLSILQDNHEVVVSIGSVFNHGNVRSFIQSDMSIGVLPTRRGPVADKEEACLHHHHSRVVEPSDFCATNAFNKDISLYRNVAELIASSCTLSASRAPSILPIVTTLILQARLRLSGIGNCVEFAIHANLFVTLVNLVAVVVRAPLLISPTAVIFELNVIIPILAISCTYTAYADIDPMKTIPSRHNYFVRLAIFRHSLLVWCLRYLPSLIALLTLGITCGEHLCEKSAVNLPLSATDKCMTMTRGYIVLTLNYWLLIHSWTHISRHHSLLPNLSFKTRYGKRSMYLFKSFRLIFACVLATVLSMLFVILSTISEGVTTSVLYPSPIHFFTSLLFPVVLLLLDVPIKAWRARRFSLTQKFRRLSFGTRLGMHSPRGDYEPEGVPYTSPTSEANRDEDHRPTLKQRLHDLFYRFTTMKGGKLELNCVCCDHIDGNYATYHISAGNL